MNHRLPFEVKGKKSRLTIGIKFFFVLFCILLSAYFLVISCGKKGPPTLKTSPPPPQSESVDSNNVETPQGKIPAEKH